MFIYSYIATNTHNQLTHSTIIANNKQHAFISLSKKNLIPLKIKFKRIFILDRENMDYRIHFFHQLSLLSSSGISLVQCLKILYANCYLPFWADMIEKSILHIEKGERLSQHLKNHPEIFNDTIISIIIVAEQTGQYEESFKVINTILEHNNKSSLLIRKSIRYPITLSFFSIILLVIMMLYVVPQFESIYENVNHELPLITKTITVLSSLLNEYLPILFTFFPFLLVLFFKFKNNFISILNRAITYIPLIKKISHLHYLSLYFLTMHSTLKVGLSLPECLKCTTQTIKNHHYHKDCQQIYESVHKGKLLSHAMNQTQFFPTLSVQLISIAEESDKVHYFSYYLFKYYSEQYMLLTERKIKNLEPILLVFIAMLVGVIMLGMYLPIFYLGNVITEL